MIVVNFKRYVTEEQAISLAQICKRVNDELGVRIVICPQLVDLQSCIETGIDCWTQKYEPTAVGHQGTLLNHSDYKLDYETIEQTFIEIESGEICICCNSVKEGVHVADLRPNFIAYEPEELIGSTEKSVSSIHSEDIGELIRNVDVPVLIGAGIHSPADIRSGLKMGAKGVLLATSVVKATDPEAELRKLVGAFKMKL